MTGHVTHGSSRRRWYVGRRRERRSLRPLDGSPRGRPLVALGSALLFVVAVGATNVGCGVFVNNGPTPVAQGQYYASGNPEYDQFFLELYETQVAMATTPERLLTARHGLADGLGVGRDLPDEVLVEHVRTRVRDLADEGRIMKLQVSAGGEDKPPAAVLRTRPETRDETMRKLTEPVEKVSNELVSLRTLLDENGARIERLERRLDGLRDRADEVFVRDITKFHEVKRNLEDAKRVLAYMRERAEEQLLATTGLLDGMVQATDSSGGAFDRSAPAADAPAEEIASPSAKPAPPKRSPATRKPAASKPAASTKPAAPPPPAKPAPKPAPPPPAAPPPSEPVGFEP